MAMRGWTDWTPREKAVLLFLREGPDVLLIHKKRGLGTGKVNGPGGRLEPGETWSQAAIRETQEETGLTPHHLTEAADLKFQFVDGYSLQARVFLAQGWTGNLTACEEADPFWHPADRLPWSQMWADDPLWLPALLAGGHARGWFLFDGDRMQEAHLEICHRPPGPFGG